MLHLRSVSAACLFSIPLAVPIASVAGQELAEVSACDGRVVSEVELRSQQPRVFREAPGWARPILRFALASRTTDSSAVLPFLLLERGDVCTEFLRGESERLLRAQPYLADAAVTAIPDETGGVRLMVETSDDLPLILGASFRDQQPRRLEFGSGNLRGKGMLLAGEWERGYAYREGLGVKFEHYHAFGGRQTVSLQAVRGPLHELFEASVARPYLTNAQSLGWHAGLSRGEQYVSFPRVGRDAISLPVAREVYGAAALARVGGQSRRLLAGVSLARELLEPLGEGVVVTDSGLLAEPGALPRASFAELRSTRIATVLGARWLEFSTLQVLDSLSGSQDVPSGMLLLTSLGYEFGEEREGADGSEVLRVRHPFVVAEAFIGAGWDRGFMGFNLGIEGRRAPGGGWRDVVAGGEASWYRRATERRTHAATLEYSATWKSRRPYRLTLADPDEGVRGYRGSHVAGGSLAVLRLEERWSAGGFGELAGFGGALFTDVGKMWANDVPFGYSTGLRASLGASVLVAVPRNSQSFYRLDVAMPLMRDRDASSWSLRFSRQLAYSTFRRESGNLGRARAVRPEAELVVRP